MVALEFSELHDHCFGSERENIHRRDFFPNSEQ